MQVQLTVSRNPDGSLAFHEGQAAGKPATPETANPKPVEASAAGKSEVKK
jgi:hypothetical protein